MNWRSAMCDGVRQVRDRCRGASSRHEEFAYGIIYDAICWTEPESLGLPKYLETIDRSLEVAARADPFRVRDILMAAGFNVTPPGKATVAP